jgi:hypothetical protein
MRGNTIDRISTKSFLFLLLFEHSKIILTLTKSKKPNCCQGIKIETRWKWQWRSLTGAPPCKFSKQTRPFALGVKQRAKCNASR